MLQLHSSFKLNVTGHSNRKGFNSLNALVTAGCDKLVYDLVVNAAGSIHDAGIYQLSEVKAFLESRVSRQLCLADSA